MKVSVITVCYNSADTLRHAIESVVAQSHEDIEYIVIDGASADGTPSILNEYEGQIARVI